MKKCKAYKLLALEAKERMQNASKNVKYSQLNNKEYEQFYLKVCQMFDENKDVVNPIAKLIDYSVYNSLEGRAKEKYFFELIDKYNECKLRYEREQRLAL